MNNILSHFPVALTVNRNYDIACSYKFKQKPQKRQRRIHGVIVVAIRRVVPKENLINLRVDGDEVQCKS